MLASLLVLLESHPYEAHLERNTPVYGLIQCVGAHSPELPGPIRRAIKRSLHSDRALRDVEKEFFKNPMFKSFAGTSQAIDLIQGGVKSNALPEQAWAVVNHRITTQRFVVVMALAVHSNLN